MVDPFVITALVIGILQLGIQLSSYVQERKRRKQEAQQQLQLQQELHRRHFSSAANMISYSICYVRNPTHNRSHPSSSTPNSDHAASLLSRLYPSTPSSYNWLELLGGHMDLPPHQQAPHYPRQTLGMRTGSCAYNDPNSSFQHCFQHWKSLQENISHKAIAVVDWNGGNIDMFMEIGGAYFRNYRICKCEVAKFALEFQDKQVFSGEIKDEKLEMLNKEMEMVEILSGVQSTNSWMRLGIYDESEDLKEVLREGVSFLQMVRGAVFGLVCCLYEDPSHINVDMETSPFVHLDIVRITSLHQQLVKRNTCLFSVFSFGDYSGWASQDILVG